MNTDNIGRAVPSIPMRQRPVGAPANGLQFARIAILKLSEITSDDVERKQAFALVREWVNEREA